MSTRYLVRGYHIEQEAGTNRADAEALARRTAGEMQLPKRVRFSVYGVHSGQRRGTLYYRAWWDRARNAVVTEER